MNRFWKQTLPQAIFWVILSLLVGYFGSHFRPGLWYDMLLKPAWTPPDFVFAPVWTTLYILMGIAAYLVWRRRKTGEAKAAQQGISFFIMQLVLNGLWSYIFFGQHLIGMAAIEIVILWLAIFVTMILFWRVSTIAGVLLLPYLLWVSYATALTFAIWRLN